MVAREDLAKADPKAWASVIAAFCSTAGGGLVHVWHMVGSSLVSILELIVLAEGVGGVAVVC